MRPEVDLEQRTAEARVEDELQPKDTRDESEALDCVVHRRAARGLLLGCEDGGELPDLRAMRRRIREQAWRGAPLPIPHLERAKRSAQHGAAVSERLREDHRAVEVPLEDEDGASQRREETLGLVEQLVRSMYCSLPDVVRAAAHGAARVRLRLEEAREADGPPPRCVEPPRNLCEAAKAGRGHGACAPSQPAPNTQLHPLVDSLHGSVTTAAAATG
mmetsp:Transcript_2377/g.7022  ORF Transcript_2377/g.7022 Transcript_2377/m.7022 type:complete len:217 (-) Transcript_2377:770-1420(-)